ncbi:MAG: helix-turn-helix domain-containing protein [Acidiferrobacterales bacterium]
MEKAQRLVGICVRVIRSQRRLTLDGLAHKAGITYQYLSAIENGRENFSIEVIERIARALRISLRDFCMHAFQCRDPDLMIERLREGVIVTDAGFRILQVNSAYTDMTGCGSQEVIGKTPTSLQSGKYDEAFFAAMHGAIERSGLWSGEIRGQRRNGETYSAVLEIIAVTPHRGMTPARYLWIFSEIAVSHAAGRSRSRAFQDMKPES